MQYNNHRSVVHLIGKEPLKNLEDLVVAYSLHYGLTEQQAEVALRRDILNIKSKRGNLHYPGRIGG